MLEDRALLATFTVTSLADNTTTDAFVTLREAIASANAQPGADTITFASNMQGQTITLGGTQLTITDSVTITGPGADLLTVDANNASRIFNVDDGTVNLILSLIHI